MVVHICLVAFFWVKQVLVGSPIGTDTGGFVVFGCSGEWKSPKWLENQVKLHTSWAILWLAKVQCFSMQSKLLGISMHGTTDRIDFLHVVPLFICFHFGYMDEYLELMKYYNMFDDSPSWFWILSFNITRWIILALESSRTSSMHTWRDTSLFFTWNRLIITSFIPFQPFNSQVFNMSYVYIDTLSNDYGGDFCYKHNFCLKLCLVNHKYWLL